MKYVEELHIRKIDQRTGAIEAAQVWPTGYQALLFDNRKHFDRFKASMHRKCEARNKELEAA